MRPTAMDESKKEIVIASEDAVFWLDRNGCWRNQGGKFRHKKVIDFFHAAIRKDDGGYYLHQVHDDWVEKVYFRYEDTALFVFDVILNGQIDLVLNTGSRIRLAPAALYVQDDHLYFRHGEDRIKFTERALMKLADRLEFNRDRYYFKSGEQTIEIPVYGS
jgi:hypothetical protein